MKKKKNRKQRWDGWYETVADLFKLSERSQEINLDVQKKMDLAINNDIN